MEDQFFVNVASLLHFDGVDGSTTFTDVLGKTWTANGNAQLDTAQSQFGGASGLFDGTTDFISTADSSDFDFGSGDFCIEFWIRPDNTTGFKNIIGKRLGFDYAPFTIALDGNKIRFRSSKTGISFDVDNTGTISISAGTWYHVAIVRDSGVFTQYVGGVADGTGALSGALMTNTSGIYVGAQSNGASAYFGHIDELRICKGVARYTAAFTPHTSAHPDVGPNTNTRAYAFVS